jgi:hypothetical protein
MHSFFLQHLPNFGLELQDMPVALWVLTWTFQMECYSMKTLNKAYHALEAVT